jgi:RHS repeat-associated protein
MMRSAVCASGVRFSRSIFAGKERDTESGNDYFKYRYYASSMGRWLSPDPSGLRHVNLADPQELNLYNYVGNNPLTRKDLDGLCWKGFQWACNIGQAIDNGVHNLGQSFVNASEGMGFHTNKTVDRNIEKAHQILRVQGINTEGMKEEDILKAAKLLQPRVGVTNATDVGGLAALGAGKAGKYALGPVSSLVSLWNDRQVAHSFPGLSSPNQLSLRAPFIAASSR